MTAIKTQGTLLEVSISAVWTEVAEITDFDGPGGESSEIDITHLQSTAREYHLGLKDEGDFSFTAFLRTDDDGQNHLQTLRDSGDSASFRLTYVNGAIRTFTARVKAMRESGGVDDAIKAAISLRITGAVTRS